jgi:hypothetical protein
VGVRRRKREVKDKIGKRIRQKSGSNKGKDEY